MNCERLEALAPALARAEAVEVEIERQAREHLGHCESCRDLIESQRRLSHAFAAVAREDATLQAPPAVRRELIAIRHARSLRPATVGWISAAAAAIAVWAMLSVGGPSRTPPLPKPSQAEVQPPQFTPIPSAEPWSPAAGGRIMRVYLPADAPSLFGMPFPDQSRFGRIEADILLGNDGTAHAIRFLPGSSTPRALNR